MPRGRVNVGENNKGAPGRNSVPGKGGGVNKPDAVNSRNGGRQTPAMAQYNHFRQQYPDSILFFHMGDFYETFGEDAERVARELNLTLTSRSRDKEGNRVPLAGVPYHSAEGYIARLVAKGYKVALCDQVEDPKSARGVVKRDVVRVITPGTVTDAGMITDARAQFLMAVYPVPGKRSLALAFLEVSTGEFFIASCPLSPGMAELVSFSARMTIPECIVPHGCPEDIRQALVQAGVVVTPFQEEAFGDETARELLQSHFMVTGLGAFGCEEVPGGVSAAGAALAYARETRRVPLSHVRSLHCRNESGSLVLDAVTIRNLEVMKSLRTGERAGSLLGLIDTTLTPMGGRQLAESLSVPLRDIPAINDRLDAVEWFVARPVIRDEIRGRLRSCGDLERIAGRIVCGNATPRDLLQMGAVIREVPLLASLIRGSPEDTPPAGLSLLYRDLPPIPTVADIISHAICDDPPATIRNGGVIRDGYSAELDTVRKGARDGRSWMVTLQSEERERTGIRSLKVAYNSVFGYFIEVTRANIHLVPPDYERKQTTATAERYTTPLLREKAAEIAGAESRLIVLEEEIYRGLLSDLEVYLPDIHRIAAAIGAIDRYCALALLAANSRWTRPVLSPGPVFLIREGRHPVIDQSLPGTFVPNDTVMDASSEQILILTGANMAGKSTYMRTVALITILAQAGSYVPANYAQVGICDRIFTRVGASDDLAGGRSTFMVEMVELAHILRHATVQSLILLDEIGRGTGTLDGTCIAAAVIEFLHGRGKSGPRTLFATHFHDMVDFSQGLSRVRTYHFAVKEEGHDIVFLRRMVPGATDRSYGIQVARLAGIPGPVISRAGDLLSRGGPVSGKDEHRRVRQYTQMLLLDSGVPDPVGESVLREIREAEPDTMTPLAALSRVVEWKSRLKGGG